ncbi:MAG: serine--tRNA ligase [Bacteroidales bacterium]|jgi:seryl-tRNA synthetase|nr:serine--tRNA ligase [Bacteroidales bacterium]
MLQIQIIRENPEVVVKKLQKKHFANASERIAEVLEVDALRRKTQQELDAVLAEINKSSKNIGVLMAQGKKDEAEQAKNAVAALKETNRSLSETLAEAEARMRELLLSIPNLPSDMAPEGRGAEENELIVERGKKPVLDPDAIPHWDLAVKYDIIDFELGNKITGSGFPVYKGRGAKLQRALISFFLDRAVREGYVEVQPPLVVNEASGFGTGQLPDKDGQMYFVTEDKLYLIPTAEVPVTNIYRDVILQEKDLPKKNCAYSACFRREAGSYGKDVRGLNRLHQFDKVEIVQISLPHKSYAILDEMCAYVSRLLNELELPYRIMRLSGGDMSFASALTYDFEVWSAAQQRWLEVSSVSNFESYQANRLGLRYKTAEGKTVLAHTLNGSALALPRIVAALLENNQTPNGILIPYALRKFTEFDMIL